ncbi:hypothetical protein AVEN_255075-1 [Araneus ventricosus]|uniref:Uncharacterized protein n=1 Tax=Araneus ventricosus TaxID=182803 RepID=A0A4Y2JZ95_ARAVE|nr:hypothetical protein AVEN_255075-1 [Araneus ventricosus]
MYWIRRKIEECTNLHIIQNGNMLSRKFRKEIPEPFVLSYSGAIGHTFLCMTMIYILLFETEFCNRVLRYGVTIICIRPESNRASVEGSGMTGFCSVNSF